MIQIEIAKTVLRRNGHLAALYVVLISVDNGPDSFLPRGPTAGVNTIAMHRVKGLPSLARKEARDASLDGCHAASCLAVSWRDAVPNSPNVFPDLPAFAIEERVLQVVRFVSIPAIRDVHHVARFEPAKSIHTWDESELRGVLAPRHHVPR